MVDVAWPCPSHEERPASAQGVVLGAPGKRHRGRPLGTWRRTIEDEMETAGKTWNELRWLAQDRSEWKKFVGTLCSPQRGSED